MNKETIALQDELFYGLATMKREEMTVEVVNQLDRLLTEMLHQQQTAEKVADFLKRRRDTFMAMRNEINTIVHRRK